MASADKDDDVNDATKPNARVVVFIVVVKVDDAFDLLPTLDAAAAAEAAAAAAVENVHKSAPAAAPADDDDDADQIAFVFVIFFSNLVCL